MCADRPATAVAPVVKSSELQHVHAPVTDNIFPDTSDGCTAVAINRRRRGPHLGPTGCIHPINMRRR